MAGLLAVVLSCAWLVQAEARITKTMDQWVCDYCSMGKYQHAYWAIIVIPETVKDIFWPIGIGQKPFPLTFWRIADDAALLRSPGGPQRVRHPHPLRVLRAAGLHRGADRLHHALQGGPQIEQSDKLANCQLWATGERRWRGVKCETWMMRQTTREAAVSPDLCSFVPMFSLRRTK